MIIKKYIIDEIQAQTTKRVLERAKQRVYEHNTHHSQTETNQTRQNLNFQKLIQILKPLNFDFEVAYQNSRICKNCLSKR